MRWLITAALLAAFISTPVQAAQGIAISQAPEAGTGICFGEEPQEAIACARELCADQSGLDPQECLVQLWCQPHRWAADIFMMHEEGAHWHSYVCDAASREELEALIAVKCDYDYLLVCEAVAIWDHDGREYAIAEQ